MKTKICSKCKKELPITEFRWRNKAQNKLHSQCKICEKEADKKRYATSKERKEKVLSNTLKYKQNNISFIDKYKEKGCCKCGEKRPYLMEFHHINPEEKTNTIAHMIKSSSLDNLKKEVEKCVLLCANCHREFHYLEKNNNITLEEYLEK